MTLSLQGFKDEFHEKNVSAGIVPDELNAYLAQSYKGEKPLYLTAMSTTQEKKAFYNQAKALYRIGKDQGLTGFKELSGKFKEVQSEKEPDDDYHNINEIKKSMEGIVFQIDKDKESGKELDPKLNDYPFLCGDGTLTNLQSILQDLTLNSSTVDDMLMLTKKQLIEQYMAEFYSEQKEFLGRMEQLPEHPIYEVHNISSLMNVVAEDYGLQKKTAKDDQYLVDINPDMQEIVKRRIENQLNKDGVDKTLIDLTADRIIGDLPKFEAGKDDRALTKNMDEFLENLALTDKLNMYSLMEIDEKTYQIKGYKENAADIIKDTIAIHLHEKGVAPQPDIEFLKAKVGFLESGKQKIDNLSIDEYAEEHGLEERLIDYALQHEREIGGKNPLEYAILNNWKIGDQEALEWAIQENRSIDGKPVIKWAVDNDYPISGEMVDKAVDERVKIDGKSAIHMVLENDLHIDGKTGLTWAIEREHSIGGKSPLDWTMENDLQVGGKPALQYAIDNLDHLGIDQGEVIKAALKNDLQVGGKPALQYVIGDLGIEQSKVMKYAVKNDLQVGGKPALQYAIDDLGYDAEETLAAAYKKDYKVGNKPVQEWAENNGYSISGVTQEMASMKSPEHVKSTEPKEDIDRRKENVPPVSRVAELAKKFDKSPDLRIISALKEKNANRQTDSDKKVERSKATGHVR